MVKRICIIFVLLFTTFSFGASDYDKNIVVKNQTRNDKVKTVFREMMDNYEEEDIGQFFFYVSEDRFEQDYMTFYDAIDEDMRIYDILNIDTWVNKITEDGVKRFLEVQWEKRYESSKPVGLNRRDLANSNEYEIVQNGTTEFLFDEINGKYKLIKISGNNFWGGSLPEWKDEVGDISGQESKDIVGDNVNGEYGSGGGAQLPDLAVQNITCPGPSTSPLEFDIVNVGQGVALGSIEYEFYEDGSSHYNEFYSSDIGVGQSVHIVTSGSVQCGSPYYKRVIIDPNNLIDEIDSPDGANNQGDL